MLWASSESISILSPSRRFWTKNKSNIQTIEAAYSIMHKSREDKMSDIFIKGVASLEAFSSALWTHFGETSVKGDCGSSSHILFVEVRDQVESSTARMVASFAR